MIVLGPGSLYTSIIPNLLVDGIVKAIRESDALKVYVCNVMTQEGGDGGLHRIRPHRRHLRPFGAGPVPPVPHQLLAHPQGGGRPVRGGGGRAHPLRQVRLRGPGRGGRGAAGGHGGERLCPPQLRGLAGRLILLHAERSVRIAGARFPPPGGRLPDGGAEMSPTITQSWRRPTHVLFL